jgi:lipopolysaccharide transport system permease protein
MTSIIFTVIFNNVAGIETGSINSFVYNLSGIILWNYFSDCLIGTSDTFKKNENIFGKVYFPRAVMPLSVILSNLIKLTIQLFIFVCFYTYFSLKGQSGEIGILIILTPLLIIMMGVTGLGLGMIVSSLTTKYRDLVFLIQFGVQLLMYLSAVMYPIELAEEKLPKSISFLVSYNPLALVINNFRNFVFHSANQIIIFDLIYPLLFSILIFIFGLLIFNKTEKTFIDTI